MDDLGHRNSTEGNEDDGEDTVLSVVPYTEEDEGFIKVSGDVEENEEDMETGAGQTGKMI